MNDSAKLLLLNYQRKLDLLPPFDDKNFTGLLNQIESLSEQIRQDAQKGNNELYCTCLVNDRLVARYRRILLAYSRQRLMDIQKFRWQFGAYLPKEIEENMTNDEKIWLRKYNKNYIGFVQKSCYNLDLTTNCAPPKGLRVEVKCMEDFGELETVDGVVNLFKGSNHFLFLADCERLIKEGVLQHLVE